MKLFLGRTQANNASTCFREIGSRMHVRRKSVSTTPPTTRQPPRRPRSSGRCNRGWGNSQRGTRSRRGRKSEMGPDLERKSPRARTRGAERHVDVKIERAYLASTVRGEIEGAHLSHPGACLRIRNRSWSVRPNLPGRQRTAFPSYSRRSNPAAPGPCPASR